jgi:hypothetical protein
LVLGTTYSDATPYAEERFNKKRLELAKIHTFGKIYSDALGGELEGIRSVFMIGFPLVSST